MNTDVFEKVEKGDLLGIKDYLKNGGSPNVSDSNGSTLLIESVIQKNIPIIRMLLESGADPNLRNSGNGSPLHIIVRSYNSAVLYGDTLDPYRPIIEILLDYGADINYCHPYFGTVLHELAKSRLYVDMLRFFLEKGADPNLKTESNWTPLHFATTGLNLEGVEMLLKYGADKDIVTCDGRRPLDFVRRAGAQGKLVELLS